MNNDEIHLTIIYLLSAGTHGCSCYRWKKTHLEEIKIFITTTTLSYLESKINNII